MFLFVVLYLTTTFRLSLIDIYITVLIFALVMSAINIMWYNKKKNIKTRVIDWIGVILCLIVLIVALFLFFKENKLENAVHNVIEEKVEDENFTIEFIDEMKKKKLHCC